MISVVVSHSASHDGGGKRVADIGSAAASRDMIRVSEANGAHWHLFNTLEWQQLTRN